MNVTASDELARIVMLSPPEGAQPAPPPSPATSRADTVYAESAQRGQKTNSLMALESVRAVPRSATVVVTPSGPATPAARARVVAREPAAGREARRRVARGEGHVRAEID